MRRLDHLVEEAAEMAGLEAGEIELHFEAVDPQNLVDAAIQHQKKALGQRPLIINVEARLPAVRADMIRADNILVQLIDNADFLYSPKEQPITITAENSGDFVTFSVSRPRAGN